MKPLNVLVRYEGGLGDCLLANRFLKTILRLYPDSEIIVAFDNDRGEDFQLDVLRRYYSHPRVIYTTMKYAETVLHGEQFQYYNLHIDAMDWVKYTELNPLGNFYHFPRPQLPPSQRNNICLHLTHQFGGPKFLCQEYIEGLVKDIHEKASNAGWTVSAITQPNLAEAYENVSDLLEVKSGDIIDMCQEVLSSKVFVTLDSGFKYLAYGAGIPTVEMSSYHDAQGRVPRIIKERWIPFPERGFPMHWDTKKVAGRVEEVMKNPIMCL